jgi:hypothetical protein
MCLVPIIVICLQPGDELCPPLFEKWCQKITEYFKQKTDYATSHRLYGVLHGVVKVEVSQYVKHDPEQEGNPIA